jgi:parallel beta-helix repeat protein
VVYQGNTIDGRIGSVRGVGVNYPYKWLRCGQYGIRIDCDNAVVSGNVIRGIIGKGIVMANETGREHKNYNITGNILAECSSGIYIQNSSHGIVSNNIIRAYEPDSGSRQLKLTWKNGIFITGKSSTDILISQNMIYGSKYAWYYDSAFVLKNTKKGGPSISLEHNILYGRGDWVRIGYDENNSGLPYYIQSVQNENIVFNVPLNSDVPQGVKVYISPRDAFEFAGVGVAVTEAKEIFIKNNVFLDCVEPYRAGMKTTSTEGNTFIRCTVSPHEIINPQ